MRNWFDTIVNADRYALSDLPPSQRFQVMTTLSLMWTAIFCAVSGAWIWYGQLVVGHVLIALGFIATSVTFRSARELKPSTAAEIQKAKSTNR